MPPQFPRDRGAEGQRPMRITRKGLKRMLRCEVAPKAREDKPPKPQRYRPHKRSKARRQTLRDRLRPLAAKAIAAAKAQGGAGAGATEAFPIELNFADPSYARRVWIDEIGRQPGRTFWVNQAKFLIQKGFRSKSFSRFWLQSP